MKKLRLWIAVTTAIVSIGSVLVFTGCQKENGPEDLLDLDMSNISMMTPGQQAVFDEATRRLDKYISFDANAGQYIMQSGVTATQVGLSQRFYAYFMRNFEATNTQLLEQQLQGYIAVEISKNCLKIINPEDGFDIYTRGGAGRSFGNEDEWEIGGINSFETYWFGVTVKLSNQTLKYMLAGSGTVGTISGLFPAAPAQVVSEICYYLDSALAVGIVAYPNGIEISVGTDGCYIKGQ